MDTVGRQADGRLGFTAGDGRHAAAHAEEVAISAPTPATWAYAENFVLEDDVLGRARARADELGCAPVLPGVGAMLRVLAAAAGARSVVEVGTGTGVSGVYLLRGMPEDGVLTTIDVEVENQRAAREAFAEAGIRSNRTRVIPGRALEVLPRLTDSAYDLVFLDADKIEYDAYVDQALRLLRPGGLLAVDNALWHDRVADPAQRDLTTTAVRELGKRVRDDPRLVPAMLSCGDGLLLAVTR
ncbi:MAG TPA: class I SAM-dependent methyltransferase [Kineosporiaceae bacterium]|nr:class I SAM-dependent methyltransferase [Kineosporiaceae bacterium]